MIRLLTLFVAILVLASLSVGEAQQPKKIPRVAFLSASVTGADSERYERIRQHLRELGYIERQNISIEYRSAGGSLDRYREAADELVRRNVDIIVVGGGTIYVEAVKKATNTIPIVMTGPGSDPVQAGLIASLARPGGNITGLTISRGSSAGSAWSCSMKPCLNSRMSPFFTTQPIRPMPANWKRASDRRPAC